LSNSVKTNIVEVLTQSTQLSQSQEFGLAKIADLVFLSQIHSFYFAILSLYSETIRKTVKMW
jgi:hypothetical protein